MLWLVSVFLLVFFLPFKVFIFCRQAGIMQMCYFDCLTVKRFVNITTRYGDSEPFSFKKPIELLIRHFWWADRLHWRTTTLQTAKEIFLPIKPYDLLFKTCKRDTQIIQNDTEITAECETLQYLQAILTEEWNCFSFRQTSSWFAWIWMQNLD